MTLDIHDHCVSQMLTVLKDTLEGVTVSHGNIVDYYSCAGLKKLDGVLPEKGKVANELKKFIGDNPASTFAFEWLGQQVFEEANYSESDRELRLTEIPGFSDLEKVSEKIMSDFKTLPWEYCFSFPINKATTVVFDSGSVEIGGGRSFFRSSDDFSEVFPEKPAEPKPEENISLLQSMLLLLEGRSQWVKKEAYFQVQCNGFVGRWLKTIVSEDAQEDFRSVLGLLISMRVLDVGPKGSNKQEAIFGLLHRKVNGRWELIRPIELSTDLSVTISKLKPHVPNVIGNMEEVTPVQNNFLIKV